MRRIADTTENLGGICFGIGSFLFFYLFFQSRYIPRALAALGLCASIIWTTLYFANLIFPEQHALFQYICFVPMVLAEVSTGFYLMLFFDQGRSPRRPAGGSDVSDERERPRNPGPGRSRPDGQSLL